MNIEQRHDKSRFLVISSDTACGLDIFRRHFGLTKHDHQSKARDVQSDRDHIGGKRHIHVLIHVEGQSKPPLCLCDEVCFDT